MEPFGRVTGYLMALRRGMRSLAAREAVYAGLVVTLSGAGVGLCAALCLGAGPGRWGWAPIAVAVVSSAWLAGRLWWRPRRAHGSDLALARWLEERIPGLHSAVVTAVETAPLVRHPEARAELLGFSPALASASAERAADQVERIPAASLLDGRRAAKLGQLALAVLAAWGVAGLATPDQVEEALYNLTHPAPDQAAADLSGRTVDVLVGDLELRIQAPAYLELKAKEVSSTHGDVAGVVGTLVTLTGTVLEPAAALALVFEAQPDSRWPVALTPEGVVTGSFRIGASDRYQFLGTAADGTLVRERTWRAITARADDPPEITLLAPESDLVVHAGDEVPLVYEALDDHGVAQVELVARRVAAETSTRRALRSPQREKTVRGSDALAVAQLGLEPGDAVDLWLEATDANTVSGPGVGRSATRRLTMYSPEQAHEAILGSLEELIDRLIDRLGDRLESPIEERKLARFGSYVAAHRRIQEATLPVLAALDLLVAGVRTDPLASEALQKGLAEVAARLREGHETEATHLERSLLPDVANARPATLLELLHTGNEELVTALEEAAMKLKELMDQSRQDKVLEKGRELLETTGDLMEILRQMKEGGDRSALEAAAQKKLEELAAKLQRMEAEMRKLAERAPYENQNLSQDPSGTQRDLKDVASQLERAKELIAQGKIDEAMALLDEMNRQAQQMVAGLEQDFSGQRAAGGTHQLETLHQELSEMVDGQRGLHAEDQEIDKRLQKETLDAEPGALDQARSQARRIREQLDAVDDEALHPTDRAALQEARKEAKGLEDSLAEPDLEAGAEKAQALAERARALAEEVGAAEGRESDDERAPKLAHGKKQAQGAADDAQALAERLSKLSQPGEPGAKDRQELGRLARRQGQLGKELERVGSEMQGQGEQGLEERLSERFGAAREAMKQAAERLGQHDARGGGKAQKQALQELEEAMRDLEQALKPNGSKGNQSEPGISRPDDKVTIPGEDKQQLPFREELLKVMKERAPESFKAEIERYYRELIK